MTSIFPFDFSPFSFLNAAINEKPIIGGETSVKLTSAPVLASLGVSVTPTGTTQIETKGGVPVAEFAITGGTHDRAQGGEVILHQGSGLELKDAAGRIDVSDFRIDTQKHLIFADVAVNGAAVGNAAVFKLGHDGTLTFTQDAAAAVDKALGTSAITSSTVVGNAHTEPANFPFSIPLPHVLAPAPGLPTLPAGVTESILGGDTAVTLTSASTLSSLGVSVKALGFASLDTRGAAPVANIPITGGTEGPGANAVILHQGSGLELKDRAGTVDLRDFIIDTKNHVIDANVTLNGKSVGELAVFNLGAHGALTLTAAAAGAVDATLHTTAITSTTPIGSAVTEPIPGPASFGLHNGPELTLAHASSSAHFDHGFF